MCGLAGALALWPLAAARAQSAPVASPPPAAVPLTLDWRAPPACPDQAWARAAIERLLGRAPELPPDRALEARVEIAATSSPRGAGWQLRLRTDSPAGPGERTLEGAACARLADAAALILALAIDPDAVAARLHDDTAPGASAPPARPPAPPPPRPRPLTPPPRGPTGPRAWTRLAAMGELGTLPAPTGGLALAFGLGVGPVFFELEASYWFAQRVPVADMPGVGADILRAAGGLRAGAWFAAGRLGGGPWLGLELGPMVGTGVGITNPATGWRLGVDALAGGALAVQLVGPLALRADVAAGWHAVTPRFYINGVGTVYQPGPVFGRAVLGLQIRFR